MLRPQTCGGEQHIRSFLRSSCVSRIAAWTFLTKATTYADHVSCLRIPARASPSAEKPTSRSTFSVSVELFPSDVP